MTQNMLEHYTHLKKNVRTAFFTLGALHMHKNVKGQLFFTLVDDCHTK